MVSMVQRIREFQHEYECQMNRKLKGVRVGRCVWESLLDEFEGQYKIGCGGPPRNADLPLPNILRLGGMQVKLDRASHKDTIEIAPFVLED